jgi:ABC-type multidrug transport system fused ATPase/permease subunit
MSLLRFAEPASGSIWLDGIDITSIGVDDLVSYSGGSRAVG